MASKLKALDLLRVSTKQQGAKSEINIPEQKIIVEDFIRNKEWDLVDTLVEYGVSGFKNTSSERDAVQLALEMARNKEYDVLVVYHSNRLGRLADDTPSIIKELNKYNVKVVSVCEGEISVKNHIDKAMTFFRYWNNEFESITKSETISDYHLAMVEEGRFRGGNMIPFGYDLVDNGSKNHKGRRILDLVINEEEAKIVNIIFDLSLNYGYGQARTAKYLNEKGYKTKKNNSWHSSSIQNILNNAIYKGQLHMNSKIRCKEVFSTPQENLIIISPELWDKNKEIMSERRRTKLKKEDFIMVDKRNKTTNGKMLLSGLVFCGHCNMALTTMTAYKRWTTKDGVKHREAYHKYRCSSFYKRAGIKCDGQSTYSANKIDPIVIEETKSFIIQLQGLDLEKSFIENFYKEIEKSQNEKIKLQNNINICYNELKSLKDEVVKIISGYSSDFSKELINELIINKENEIEEKELLLKKKENNINDVKFEKMQYENVKTQIIDWDKRFDDADFEEKKRMLSLVIDKVLVYRDEIEIQFNVRIETYKNNSLIAENQNLISCIDRQLVRTNSLKTQSIIKEIFKIQI